ncbi:DDE superfamily endonuclease-domain-containing protein [Lipomyces kononenkoae]|uniref:DDE superfamily endonuclease-domain-containing protein n=1 Tax=Lipomyces kononenkoae TaxID=34357 RepID=A0ACC3SZL1_LIPKO
MFLQSPKFLELTKKKRLTSAAYGTEAFAPKGRFARRSTSGSEIRESIAVAGFLDSAVDRRFHTTDMSQTNASTCTAHKNGRNQVEQSTSVPSGHKSETSMPKKVELNIDMKTDEKSNLLRYGNVRKPYFRQLGRARKLSQDDENALFEYLRSQGWRQQAELVWWLLQERGVLVSQPTLSRVLKRRNWTRKELRRISLNRSDALRQAYLDDVRRFAADDLVFIDESIFNEKTGWRHHGYAPIGDEARYPADLRRGDTGSICAAMTLDGWLPCIGVKKGYYSAEGFILWLRQHLLPAVNQRGRCPTVIVMDNVSVHVSEQVAQIIEAEGHLIRYLPPYSPDFNPIELTFSVLKAWMKRNWVFLRKTCDSYGDFLHLALRESRADRYAK